MQRRHVAAQGLISRRRRYSEDIDLVVVGDHVRASHSQGAAIAFWAVCCQELAGTFRVGRSQTSHTQHGETLTACCSMTCAIPSVSGDANKALEKLWWKPMSPSARRIFR